MNSSITQFLFGLAKQIDIDLSKEDEGLVVEVYPDSIEISGTNGESRIAIRDNAIVIGDKPILDVSPNPSTSEVGDALVQSKMREGSSIAKNISDRDLIQKIETEVRKGIGL